ncbi:hypothetical protein ABIC10_008809 [Bradyrhizobium sp. S3.2.12]
MESADFETVIQDLLAGEYRRPIRVIAFNTSERWSEDVSEDVAREIQHRCNLQAHRNSFASPGIRRSLRCQRHAAVQLALGLAVAFQRKKPETPGIKAPLPGFIAPALAASVDRVPSGERWIHEIKFDGYRVQVHLANEAVTVFTRRGHDWTKRFKKVAGRRMAHKSELSNHRRRGRGAGRQWQHRFLRLAERAKGHLVQDRARRIRPAVSQRQGPPEGAAIGA